MTTNRTTLFTVILAAALFVLAACGDDSSLGEYEAPDGFPNADTGGFNDAASDSSADVLPPEVELDLQSPEAARDFVFVASSNLDAVAKIDAHSLNITTVAVGEDPRIVRARQAHNTVAVLNYGSADLSVIHARTDNTQDGGARLELERYLNQMVMSPTGDHVVVYYDEDAAQQGDPVGSFQLINVARIREGEETVVQLAVSFHVRSVQFDDAGEHAFVITDDHLHIVDLDAVIDAPESWDPADRTSLVDDPTAPLDDREVLVTPDGRWAVIRRISLPQLTLVEVGTDAQVVVDLSASPTDVDLTNGGQGVLVVVRETAELVLFDIPESANDLIEPTIVPSPMDIPIGQALLLPEEAAAIVFSTAADSATIGKLDLAEATLDTWRLGSGKAIAGAALSPSGDRVFVQHAALPESPDPVQQLHGFSILEFDTEENDGRPFDKLFQTDADVSGLVFTPDGANVYATILDTNRDIHQVVHVDLELLTTRLDTLGSNPFVIGAMPSANRVYIGQDHDLGRISFIEVETGRIQTITGFELNSRIR